MRLSAPDIGDRVRGPRQGEERQGDHEQQGGRGRECRAQRQDQEHRDVFQIVAPAGVEDLKPLARIVSRLILAPDWETVTWTETERKRGQAWGLKTIETFHTHGTPPVKKD